MGSLLPPSSLLIQPGRDPHIPLLASCQSQGLAPISQTSHRPTPELLAFSTCRWRQGKLKQKTEVSRPPDKTLG